MTFQYTEKDKQTFEANIIKTYRANGEEHCWLWHGPHNTFNYGVFLNSSDERFVHRFSFRVYKGNIPHKMDVAHICDIRCCSNPSHLKLETRSENLKERGRNNVKANLISNKIDLPKEEDKILPMTNIEECASRLIEMCLALGGEQTVKEILTIRFNGYTELIWSDEIVCGYKKKYFCHIAEVLDEYSITFDEITKYFKI